MHSCTVSDSMLSDLSKFVENTMGLHFPKERRRDLERGICSAMKDFGYEDAGLCIEGLLSAPLSRSQIETLAGHLTVGETYFYRDQRSFDALSRHILPDLVRSRIGKEQRLRIWSAGCATGEEAYSIAILLDTIIADLTNWSITILATDINPHSLNRATKGVYREWSFRDTPHWVQERYFTKTGDGFEVLPRIKKMVTFSYHNLVDDPYPTLVNNTSAMDIIFCRNVLMYFSSERAMEVVRHLGRCLMDEGWLVISPVEASHAIPSLFNGIRFAGATLYKKAGIGEREPLTCKKPDQQQPVPDIQTINTAPPDLRPMTRLTPPSTQIAPEQRVECLARAAADQGRLSDALVLCEKAVDSDKLNASLHYLYANVLQEIGRTDEAAAAFKRAIYIDQDFVMAHFALGHLMQRQEKHREAGRHFGIAFTLLKSFGQDEALPESEGISAGRLMEIIQTIRQVGTV